MLLSQENEDWIYSFINEKLRFMPHAGPEYYFLPFSINRPFAVYDISQMSDAHWELLYELAPQALQNCLKPGYMLYAIDWNHNTILYDPLDPQKVYSTSPAYRCQTKSGLTYYLGFYPDGDYYFFLDRYGAFGYLSHPWREEVWIYGLQLVEEFEKIYQQLGWIQKSLLK